MFLYFNLDYYFTMIRRVWGKKHWKGRRKLLFRLLVLVPLIYLFHSLFFFLDKIVFPGLWFQKVDQPIFIIGHARSGTTLLQRLMSQDRDRFSYFVYWEMFFPSLLERKLIRGMGILDRVLLNSYLFKRLQAWDEKTLGKLEMHEMGLWVPEEDDFVNTTSFFSGYWQIQVPMMDEMDVFHLDRKPAGLRRRMMRSYKECLRRQLYLQGGNKIHLSKNPFYCGRVQTLIDTFPDCRIIINMRDPMECVPSILKLMVLNYKLNGWTEEDYLESTRIIRDMAYDFFRLPKEVLARNPQVPQMVVDYRELTAQPRATIEKIYETLGLEITEQFRTVLEEQDEKARKHEKRGNYSYSADDYGFSMVDAIRELPEFYAQYQWASEKQSRDTIASRNS